jgi:mRNA-degrading endonuclease RelE of RelBE toxin-antitoxin system
MRERLKSLACPNPRTVAGVTRLRADTDKAYRVVQGNYRARFLVKDATREILVTWVRRRNEGTYR